MRTESVSLGPKRKFGAEWIRGRYAQCLMLIAAVLAASILFRNHSIQSVNWTFPYFSGAANFETLGDWRISPAEFDQVENMSDAAYLSHRHERMPDTVTYASNNYGYVLIALASRTIFWWMGDGNAIVAFQVIVHAILCAILFLLLETSIERWAFALLFAVNPIVIHFVTLSFYYFWAVVPCFILAVAWLRRERLSAWVIPIGLLLFAAFLIRPSTLFVCLAVFAVVFLSGVRVLAAVALVLFVTLQILTSARVNSSPWHTAYVGIGAYSNPYGLDKPYDGYGYELYKQVTGKEVATNPIRGTLAVPEERDRYLQILRARYLQILAEHPELVVRNAAFNVVQAFGFGYVVDKPWVNLLGGIVGASMILLIILFRQWIWGIGVLTYSIAFTPYFPPIPAYLFGAYLFTALAAGGILNELTKKIRSRTHGDVSAAAASGLIRESK